LFCQGNIHHFHKVFKRSSQLLHMSEISYKQKVNAQHLPPDFGNEKLHRRQMLPLNKPNRRNLMKKFWLIGILAALALIVFGTAGYAYAQSRNTNTPNGTTGYDCGMYGAGTGAGNAQQTNGGRAGRGMMGGGRMGARANQQNNADCPMWDGDEAGAQEFGPLHDSMDQAFAQALGITPAELETRYRAGDTLWTIAQEQGLTAEQFQQMMNTARDNAVNQAVADGLLTQAQADFMLERMGGMFGQGYTPGSGQGYGPGNGGCYNTQP
jgi:hypothetical protein